MSLFDTSGVCQQQEAGKKSAREMWLLDMCLRPDLARALTWDE